MQYLEHAKLASTLFMEDEGMKKFMAAPRAKDMQMPFDGRRMIYGGFQVVFTA